MYEEWAEEIRKGWHLIQAALALYLPEDWALVSMEGREATLDRLHEAHCALAFARVKDPPSTYDVPALIGAILDFTGPDRVGAEYGDRMWSLLQSLYVASQQGGCVYLVQDEKGRIKIGWTSKANPADRLSSLRTGSCDNLKLIGTLQGSRALEKRLHRRYAKYRIRGEWFALPTEALEEILSL